MTTKESNKEILDARYQIVDAWKRRVFGRINLKKTLDMAKDNPLNSETDGKGWRKHFSSYSGIIFFAGLILPGFLIAWWHGGFPSILLPAFIILAIGITAGLLDMIFKLTTKKKPEPVKPLRLVFLFIVFFLIVAWFGNAGLSVLENPGIADRILKKVEFPFSEASHVVADSEGSVYVFSQFNCRIQKYGNDGRFQFGWFSGGWKGIEMAIDENDFIYTYAYGFIIRQYDQNGNMIQKITRPERYGGWWRLKSDFVVWDSNEKMPEQYNEYNTVVKDGDLLPSTELRKTGFKTADAGYYKLTRLWYLFPVVSVEKPLPVFEGYIMPNPLSLTFTFVFPGFLFYILALILTGVFEKQTEIYTRLKYALITVAIVIIAALVFFIGTSLILDIANAQPKGPLRFCLGLLVIPYFFVVIYGAAYFWKSAQRRLLKAPPTPGNGGSIEDVSTTGLSKDSSIPSDNKDIRIDKVMRYVRVVLYPFMVVAAVGFVLTLIVHISIWAGFPLGKYTINLLLGIIIVWPPTVLVSLLLMREPEQKDFRKVCLRGCPAWMKKMSFVFSIYGFISIGFWFFGIYADIKHGNSEKGLPNFCSLGLSGVCMMFYWAAFATLYSARKILEGENMNICPNGHRVAATEIFCPYCGEKMTSG